MKKSLKNDRGFMQTEHFFLMHMAANMSQSMVHI